jgi:predicted outer membrane repeat protein
MKKSIISLFVVVAAQMVLSKTYYVSQKDSDDANPGSESAPFKTLKPAITNAVDGDIIIVDDGTYYIPDFETNGIYIAKAITLRSKNGPKKSTIASYEFYKDMFPRVLFISNEGAKVEGFSIKNGRGCALTKLEDVGSGYGGGVVLLKGTLENCIVESNSAFGYGGGIYMKGGLVSRCIIKDNKNNAGHGQCAGVLMSGGIIEHSLIAGNNMISSNNSKNKYGGISASGTSVIRNCTVVNNKGNTSAGISLAGSAVLENTISFGNVTFGGAVSDFSGSNPAQVTNLASTVAFGVVMEEDKLAEDQEKLVITDPDQEFTGFAVGNYMLVKTSRCIDAGYGEATVDKDLAGADRVQGLRMDIGAYEFTPRVAKVYELSTSDNLKEVIETAEDSDVILLNDGTYKISGGLTIDKGVALRSKNRHGAILYGDNAAPTITMTHARAVVEGVKITNGQPGAIVSAGMVTDSIIYKNTAVYGGGVKITGAGIVSRCIIRNNSTGTVNHGCGGGVYLEGNGVLEHSLIYDNVSNSKKYGNHGSSVSAHGPVTIRSCTVSKNKGIRPGILVNNASAKIIDTICCGNAADETNGSKNFYSYQNSQFLTNVCSSIQVGVVMNSTALAADQSRLVVNDVNDLFVNIDNNDFRLKNGSCCKDMAYGEPTVEKDVLGNLRVVGRRMDIGAIECLKQDGMRVIVR